MGAQVVDYRPDLGMLVIGFLPGTALENETSRTRACCRGRPTPCRRLHAGPRFIGDFDMFARQAAYLATVREHGFALPDDVRRPRAAVGAGPPRAGRRAAATVPCNNDLLAGNFIDDGERVWLIDYEYSGNNDACFELGNTWTECELDARADRRAGRPPTSVSADPARRGAGAAPGAVLASTAGRCGASSRPPPARSTSTSTAGGWSASRRPSARFTRDGFDRAARRGRRRWLSCPARAPGRRHRRRRDRLLDGLPPHQAGLDRRAAARAGHAVRAAPPGTPPGWSGRCGPPRAAPGWCSTPPSSTPASRRRPGWRPATATSAG